jgi:hypothetical protein
MALDFRLLAIENLNFARIAPSSIDLCDLRCYWPNPMIVARLDPY